VFGAIVSKCSVVGLESAPGYESIFLGLGLELIGLDYNTVKMPLAPVEPFKVTQRQWIRHGTMFYIGTRISDPCNRAISYRF